MKVILLQDVKKLGKKGDIIEANNGYARNSIIPQGLGIEANNKNLNDLKLKQANDEKVAAEELAAAKAFADKLKECTVEVGIKVGDGGKVFGSVSAKEIAQAVKDQCGYELDKKKMLLKDAIKEVGSHTVAIRLHPKVTGEFTVKVVEQK